MQMFVFKRHSKKESEKKVLEYFMVISFIMNLIYDW